MKLSSKLVVASMLATSALTFGSIEINQVQAANENSGLVKMNSDEHLTNMLLYDGDDIPAKDAEQIKAENIPTLNLKQSDLNLLVILNSKLEGIKLSAGKIKNYDLALTQLYKKDKQGKLVPAKASDFKAGEKGVVAIVVDISNLKPNTKYTFVDFAFPGDDLLWRSSTSSDKGTLSDADYPVVQVPFTVQKSKKSTRYGYARKNTFVYTAKGKKTKKKLSTKKKYSFTQKKTMKKKTFYKVGKTNNWVLASSISLKK